MYSIPLCNLQGDSSVHVVNRSAARTADLADPTTDMREAVAHPITDHNRNTSVSLGQSRHRVIVVVPVPSSCTLSSIRPNFLLFLECSRSPLTRSVTKSPLFSSFWMAQRPVVCSRASPVPQRHPSFFYNLHDCALQSFPFLSSADPTFFVQGVHSTAQSPPYTITLVTIAARSVSELRAFPRIKNASPTQMSPQYSEAEVGEAD